MYYTLIMKRQCPQCGRAWYDMGRKQECCPTCCNDTDNGCSGCQDENEDEDENEIKGQKNETCDNFSEMAKFTIISFW